MIAGRAEPGAEVTVNAGTDVVAVTKADAYGEWVVIPDRPLGGGPKELSITAVTPGQAPVRSEQVVTVVVPGPNAPAEERAVAVLQAPEGAAAPRVLQGGVPDPGVRAGELTLDAVQYDATGNVVLNGKARQGTNVQVYVDDRPVGGTAADPTGLWQVTPTETLDVGRHDLRLEQIDATGALVAKVQLPFMRAAPEAIRALAPGEVIVQPGASLWRIARNTYGRGTLHTVIFLANAQQIRDPDLIYPGQIFALPATPATR